MEHNQIPLLLLCKWEHSQWATGTLYNGKWGVSATVCPWGKLFRWGVNGLLINFGLHGGGIKIVISVKKWGF